jgi:hypothetical protein
MYSQLWFIVTVSEAVSCAVPAASLHEALISFDFIPFFSSIRFF